MNVISLKLSTGEEVIGRVDEVSPVHYVLTHARLLAMTQQGLGMFPFMVTVGDGKVEIPSNHVIGKPLDDLSQNIVDAYLEQTSSIKLARP